MSNDGFQAERSLLAMPPDTSVKFGPTKIHRVLINRRNNIKLPHDETFGIANKALVIGAGTSMSIYADMYLDMDKYDLIIITHPMANHYRHLLAQDRTWVVDCEYQPISTHYYDKYAKDVQLICRLGKEINVTYKKLAFILPENRPWSINEVGEEVPEKPYSTGAMGLWYALHKFGGNTQVDFIGLDCDGVVCRYWQELRHVVKGGLGRTKDLSIYMFEWPDKKDEASISKEVEA